MNATEKFIPLGHPNRPGKKIESLRAIVIHYTGNEHPNATDTVNVSYMGRKYVKRNTGLFEIDGVTPFRYGSAHVFCDMDSVTLAMPIDEVAWGCGDKNLPGGGYLGYQRIAQKVFGYRQNYFTLSVEICNNDVIKNSDEDWDAAVENAHKWIKEFLKQRELQVDITGSLNPQQQETTPEKNFILILRHYDITGKVCPAPFVKNTNAWKEFVKSIAA